MIVLDASVAVKLILTETYSAQVIALLTSTAQAGEPIVAPTLLPYEVANILRQRMVRQGMALSLADRLMADFLTFPIALQTSPTMHQRALAIADIYGLPAAYDAHYIALAEELGADLWTDDQRLLRALAGRVPFVRWIGSY
ncbi:MAG TPA: type II toxin-antitoxin system VapC family toxin [Chloroflexota bacterium]|nr:type II toxin-antitoxin system VapC family toxin [Chloroflexota bacterium]